MKEIKIFLASSIVEFEHERNELRAYFTKLNNQYHKYGIFLKFETCEDLSNAIAKERKQEEYNQKIRESDFFYIIFGREAGQYTLEEFDVALAAFKDHETPRIYTYFQKLPKGTHASESVIKFMTRLDNEIGHYYSQFSHFDSIKLDMMNEIISSALLNETIEIKDGKALVNGKKMLSLENVPIFKNNENLQKLREKANILRKERAELTLKYGENQDDTEVRHRLSEVDNSIKKITDQLHQIEKTTLKMCSTIVERNSFGKPITVWEKEARRYLYEGDYDGALAILRDPAIDEEFDHVDKIMDVGGERIEGLINTKRLMIQTLMAKGVNQETLIEIYECYERCEKTVRKYKVETDIIYEYACFLDDQKDYENAIIKAEWLQKFYELEEDVSDDRKSKLYNLLGNLYGTKKYYSKAKEEYKKAIMIWERLAKQNYVVYARLMAVGYNNLGTIYGRENQFIDAKEVLEKAIEIRKKLFRENPSVYAGDLAESYNNIGLLYAKTDHYTEAEDAYKKAIELREQLAKVYFSDYAEVLAGSYNNAGDLYAKTDHYTEAEDAYKKAIELCERLMKENPSAIEGGLAVSYYNIGRLYAYSGKNSQSSKAETYYQKAVQIWERLVKQNYIVHAGNLALGYNNLAVLYGKRAQYTEAIETFEKAVALLEQLVKDNFSAYAGQLAMSYYYVGNLYAGSNRCAEAGLALKKSEELRRQLNK